MIKSRPSGRRIGVICLLAVLVALPAIVMGPLRSSGDSSADAASAAEAGPQVRRLYLAFFEREPDPAGWQFWLEFRANGRSLEWVADRFAESQEFINRYGRVGDEEFVRLVYNNVLDRNPDPVGWRTWTGALRRGSSRGTVMVGFSESAEFRAKSSPTTSGPAAPTTTPPATTPPASTPPATTPPATTPPATTAPPTGGQAGGTSSGGLANVASGINVASYLTSAWVQNPSSGYPAFRTFCEFSHLGYNDPVVLPGQNNASHLHVFFGNRNVNASSTYQSLRTSGDSTCEGGPLNRTAYWMPALFDGNNNVVVPSDIELYYKAENAADPTRLQEFPNGLRMVAGGTNVGQAYGWACGDASTALKTIPECGGQRLIATVRFPYCWDGKNLDSADHRSHMAYGVNNTWGPCPASHPVHLPEITELFHWYNASGSASWYLASDRAGMLTPAPNGSTLHADWFGAWEDSIETQWVSCLRQTRNLSNGNLCNGTQLRPVVNYTGAERLSGWRPKL